MLPASLTENWPVLAVFCSFTLGLLKLLQLQYEARLGDKDKQIAELLAQSARWENLAITGLGIAQRTTEVSSRAMAKPGG